MQNTLQEFVDELLKDVVMDCETHEPSVRCQRCMQNIGDVQVICLKKLNSHST